jgi:ABC-type sugar transport system ATPase subunit
VVRAGRLHQAGSPRDVYRHPADTFVARFVGSPPMNVVEPALLGLEGEALVGFRPEDAELGDGVAAELLDVEEAGHELVWQLRLGDREIAVRPGNGAQASRGDRVRFRVPAGALRRFDRETGQAL